MQRKTFRFPSVRLHLNAMFLLMKQDIAMSKPQSGSVTSLKDRTLAGKRQWIFDEIMKGVDEICEKYPCLSKSTFVSHVAFLHGIMCTWSILTEYTQ